MHPEFREHLRPELCAEIESDGRRYQARVHHFDQIFVGEIAIRFFDRDGWLTLILKAFAPLTKTLVVNRDWIDINLLPA